MSVLDTIFNCVLSLMLHKCHIRYSLPRSEGPQGKGQILPSLEGKRRKKNNFHRAHSVIKGEVAKTMYYQAHSVIKGNLAKIVSTEITRSSKETQCLPSSLGDRRTVTKFAVLTEFSWLTQELFSGQSSPSRVG